MQRPLASARGFRALQESELLFHMPGDVFRHLEHGHLLFASKNSFERIVSVDQRFVLRIL